VITSVQLPGQAHALDKTNFPYKQKTYFVVEYRCVLNSKLKGQSFLGKGQKGGGKRRRGGPPF
jgi:hypothetical protein